MRFLPKLRTIAFGGKSDSERISGAGVKYHFDTTLQQHQNADPYKDPPPAYDLNYGIPSKSDNSVTADQSTAEDRYQYLSTFDTIFLIDDSTSMKGQRWEETGAVLASITPVCTSHDRDGIDVYFMNHKPHEDSKMRNNGYGYTNIKNSAQVESLFRSIQPSGATPTGGCLKQILKPYLDELIRNAQAERKDEVKPMNIIVITDGAPTDAPEEVIVFYAKMLDKLDAPAHQVGIQFFQVGNDLRALKRLNDMDNGLSKQEDIRDMVDTVTWQAGQKHLTRDGILKVVLGSVIRRLDNTSMDQISQRVM